MIYDVTALMEAAKAKSYSFHGVKVYVKNGTKHINATFDLCDENWDDILDETAKRMYNEAKASGFNRTPESLRSVKAIRKALKLESVSYNDNGFGKNPNYGLMSLSFDTNPSLDPYHCFTLYVSIKNDGSLIFDSIYDG